MSCRQSIIHGHALSTILLQGSHVIEQDPTFSDGPGVDLCLEGSLTSPHRVDKWEIPSNEIVIKELLGEGAFGKVYMGIIKCPIISPRRQSTDMNKSIFTSAAIKQLKRESIANHSKFRKCAT